MKKVANLFPIFVFIITLIISISIAILSSQVTRKKTFAPQRSYANGIGTDCDWGANTCPNMIQQNGCPWNNLPGTDHPGNPNISDPRCSHVPYYYAWGCVDAPGDPGHTICGYWGPGGAGYDVCIGQSLPVCNTTCRSDIDCLQGQHICFQGHCRYQGPAGIPNEQKQACLSSEQCVCPQNPNIVCDSKTVTGLSNNTQIQPGQSLAYKVTIKNDSTVNATNVTLNDTTNGPVSLNGTVTGATCTSSGVGTQLTLTCNNISLNAGESKTIEYQLKVSTDATTGTVNNTATVSPHATGNASCNLNFTIQPPVNPNIVCVSKEASIGGTALPSSGTVQIGQTIHYKISYKNTSTVAATNASVVDTLPTNVTLQGIITGATCTNSAGTITCSNITIQADETKIIEFDALVGNNATGNLTNTATVSPRTTGQATCTHVATITTTTTVTPPTTTPPTTTPPTNTPTVVVPTSPGMLNCSQKGCDNSSTGINRCKDGLSCVKVNTENSWYCSLPQLTSKCQENPTYDNCCNMGVIGSLVCGAKGCKDDSNPCKSGLTCVVGKDENYCSIPSLVSSCKKDSTYESCCSAPTTPVIAQATQATKATTTQAPKPTLPETGEKRWWYLIPAGIVLLGLFL